MMCCSSVDLDMLVTLKKSEVQKEETDGAHRRRSVAAAVSFAALPKRSRLVALEPRVWKDTGP